MLRLKEVSYAHPNNPPVFNKLNFTLKPGEILGLYGKSGSGKTTMAKILAGYLKPDEGKVVVNSKSIHGANPVQMIWQHPEKAINPRWRMKKVLEESGMFESDLVQKFGIQEKWSQRYPSELSGGELQRFCLIRALNESTEFLIADEITTMLDALTQAQIWQSLKELVKERNLGVLAISHDLALLKQISDRIINFNELTSLCQENES